MSNEINEFFAKFQGDVEKMKVQMPDMSSGFGPMFSKIMKDGVISLKQKELIAVSLGVALQCDPCIKLHTKKSLDAGATKEEILEAVSVAVVMAGGPAYTHLPVVMDTIEALQS